MPVAAEHVPGMATVSASHVRPTRGVRGSGNRPAPGVGGGRELELQSPRLFEYKR